MPTFAAIKIHYDHRAALAPHLKYSVVPSQREYDDYLELFREEGIGGNGFHECLNFAVTESDPLRFYLPPTSIPSVARQDDEFVFFSFTYKGDQELPSHIVGVHAGARLVNREGQERGIPFEIESVEPLMFHAEAASELVTLLTPPLAYEVQDGIYTPAYNGWGNGLRYINETHATNIVRNALRQASIALEAAGESQRVVLERQINVLRCIGTRYNLDIFDQGEPVQFGKTKDGFPDIEIGQRGERFVYERELEYIRSIGYAESEVEWTSRAVPTSPFDIRTLRVTPNGVREHFLEVKSSSMEEGANVYISSRQLDFFEQHKQSSTFALVSFSEGKSPSVRELTLDELYAEFLLQPVKYKLVRLSDQTSQVSNDLHSS
ncbi:hypothetical protein THUN1379_21050 [Paludibacterium sp. THUN1379]|uniref:protein NO VEIN domain-containing protein n=1 Tax=Paludibacterium sp. THUN1379 TaxID=3112107 RepID=UPI00308C5A46|nr:hypothetical protein THUN1379_21050 [Paludibacterium sp. THUN1379]